MKYFKLYGDFLRRFLSVKKPLTVVFDCSNGPISLVLKNVFGKHSVNCKVFYLNIRPDASFKFHGPNPLAPGATKQLKQEVLRRKADLGVIFDADGDRAIFLDNHGRIVSSYFIAYLLFLNSRGPFVADSLTYESLKVIAPDRFGSKIFPSRVGSVFIKKLMRSKKASRGVEYSGHYYFNEFFYADSGCLAAIKVINIVSHLPYKLADFADLWINKFFSERFNFGVSDRNLFLLKLRNYFSQQGGKVRDTYGLVVKFDGWFLIVRASDTEPLVRFFLGSNSRKKFERALVLVRKVAFDIKKTLN